MPDDFRDFELCLKLGIDPRTLDETPDSDVELWHRYKIEIDRKEKIKNNRANQ